MSEKIEKVPKEEAIKEVEAAITRLALLHLSFSKILIEELGNERGSELVIKSIMEYGQRINEIVSKGGSDLPKWGVYSSEPYQDENGRFIVSGCNLARVFKQFNELDLGRLYCYVDAAKSMASDPKKKLIHTTCEACGDEQCTLEFVQTTEEERRHFINRENSWKYVDPRLYKE
ncbi:MAG: L-2-amino-thiazoline-4-carboxylic acid hydrolase [Candidatus Hodarchaeales archaeon]|jgi:hypothetical protein